MPEKNVFNHQALKKNLSLRGILLILQILLPFGLYLALQSTNNLAAALIAAVFTFSMFFLVWLG